MKQIIELEDLDERDTESNSNTRVENIELQGSGWAYDRIFSKTIDLYKNVTNSGSSYNELSKKYLSILNIQNKTDIKCWNFSITAHIHPVTTNACGIKGHENFFDTIVSTVIARKWIIVESYCLIR